MSKPKLTLSPILCDGMILQREAVNHIYGTDTGADTVTVIFMEKEYCTQVKDNGDFTVALPPTAAGGPYTMTVRGSSEVIISDILFGDVYILSGQSNMELQLQCVLDVSGDEIIHTNEPEIRQYFIPPNYNFKEPEKYMVKASWNKAIKSNIMEFSAAGFFFAKEIKNKYNIPIGLIQTAVGGSRVEAWMNPLTLEKYEDLVHTVDEFKDITRFNSFVSEQQKQTEDWLTALEAEELKPEGDDYTKWSICKVPSLVSDYGRGSFHGSVYLYKEVELKEMPQKDDAYIYMGAIIDSDQVWINGKLIGRTEFRYPLRKYTIPAGILKKGKNTLLVRIVINNSNGGTVKGMPYYLYCDGEKIELEGDWYYKIAKKAEEAMPATLFPPLLPICFYHTNVVPLSRIAIKGVLWYQGESNIGHPWDYADKFTDLVADWRSLFGFDVPFIYVQLPNYSEPLNASEDVGWIELREQQRRCLAIDNVAMVTTIDIGQNNDIHPQNKKDVGIRLAKAARYLIYKEDITYSGPLPEYAVANGKSALISFQYLEEDDCRSELTNFELAGEDEVFYTAKAIREGRTVMVSCDSVEVPVYVRYAWKECPVDLNFYNADGLPAACFKLKLKSTDLL